MRNRLSRSLWVLGPILYVVGSARHAGLLGDFGAFWTVAGLFYGYWPRTTSRTQRSGRRDRPSVTIR
jgi:hypothetical protein